MLLKLISEIQSNANSEKAKIYQKFFKTNKGEYGEGDVFIGLTVPQQRKIAKKYINLSLSKIQQLLKSKIHEYRLTSLLILLKKYEKSNQRDKEQIFNFYLKNTKYINNWDLVDLTASKIVGDFLFERDKRILYKLTNSENLWEKRIAVVSTLHFIKKNEFEDILAISEILLKDRNDLIHKAIGWMLRELGKRNLELLKKFLKEHYNSIPRTTLRYAIEHFEEKERKKCLKGDIIQL